MVDPSAAERRKTNRLRFMHALYDTTHGSTTVPIDSSTVAVRLGIDEVEADAMVANLQEEGLLSIVGVSGLSSAIMLTHQGLVEVEQSQNQPEQPTQHFPPWQQVINVYGDVTDSQIAQAGHDSAQADRGRA